ncbi:hypothetical protein ACIP10_17840 [Streptomyces galbus]|uniref:hypothetical protein n=1 Tax=Streptomyces galbus TaxID=33898 RepID=UPI0037AC57FE
MTSLPEQPGIQPVPAIPPQTAAPLAPGLPPQPPVPPAAVRGRLSPLGAGLLGLTIGAGLMGSVWAITANSSDEPETFNLTGTFSLTADALAVGDSCSGTGGYDDISEGTSVTVYGAKGDVIATGQLGDSEETGYNSCDFDVEVLDVPKGERFYKVEVSHRGTVQLTAEEAENGEFGASLG